MEEKVFIIVDLQDEDDVITFYTKTDARAFLNEIFWDDDEVDAFKMGWEEVKNTIQNCDYEEIKDTLEGEE